MQRETKLRLMKSTRTGKGKSPDEIVYGVEAKTAESPPQPPPDDAPPSADLFCRRPMGSLFWATERSSCSS